jgi:hypothetical protein
MSSSRSSNACGLGLAPSSDHLHDLARAQCRDQWQHAHWPCVGNVGGSTGFGLRDLRGHRQSTIELSDGIELERAVLKKDTSGAYSALLLQPVEDVLINS